jgi:hypothetical protein
MSVSRAPGCSVYRRHSTTSQRAPRYALATRDKLISLSDIVHRLALDAQPGGTLVVEAGPPVAAREAMFGADQYRETVVDVASICANLAAELP